ncbi:glycosyltransferase family 4 protein [Halobacterium yunchengense]|uniref:glycosyltransferase family 4 protein n=1 Tax=Halobacterium yunchengense TaxID=3108497 RepID=UPI00300984BC
MRVLNLVTTEDARFFEQQVARLADHGVTQTTLAVPGRREYDEDDSGRSPLDYARFYPRVLRASFDDYDLVHANFGLTAPHAVLQPNLPVVVSLWGTDLLGEYGWVSRRFARFADATVVMSPEMADALDADCRVIPHGVDLDVFRPRPRDEARAVVGWRPDAHHVLFPYPPGREVKNYPRAEGVVDAVRDRVDDPVVLHAVTGVPHRDMPTYMNAADALLVTSDREGSPNAVKEALACNLPVVATPVGDVPARLEGVSLSRACETDAELADALADALEGGRSDGREAAREVSVERTSRRLYDVYREVLDGA